MPVVRRIRSRSSVPNAVATAEAPGIHPTAIVHPKARLGARVTVGPYTVIRERVTIGPGTTIGAHCVIGVRTTIGTDC